MIKILITGRNTRLANGLEEHLKKNENNDVIQLNATRDSFLLKVPKEKPRVIIMCLGFESERSVYTYNYLSKYVNSRKVMLILVANKQDTTMFQEYVNLPEVTIFPQGRYLGALELILRDIQDEPEEIEEKEDDEQEKPEIKEEKKYSGPKKKKVLIVDDDSEQLMQMRYSLKGDFKVLAVRSGADALEYLKKHTVDLVLLDYMMPEMDGHIVLKRIRTLEKQNDVPVIFISEKAERNRILDIITELKPQGFLVKPFNVDEVIAKINEVLNIKEDKVEEANIVENVQPVKQYVVQKVITENGELVEVIEEKDC